jgi:hypothetical protein
VRLSDRAREDDQLLLLFACASGELFPGGNSSINLEQKNKGA